MHISEIYFAFATRWFQVRNCNSIIRAFQRSNSVQIRQQSRMLCLMSKKKILEEADDIFR